MPTYSEITIAFNVDFVNDYILDLAYQVGSSTNGYTYTWVTTRSGANEVTTGTPTATAGERAAINFEAAFDLDQTTGYVTTVQNTNEVLIQSETQGEDFVGLNIRDENGNYLTNGIEFDVTFNNFEDTFDVSTVNTMSARSPYYVNTPFYFSTTTKATIAIKVWDGHFTNDEPSEATQTITKIRPTVDFAEFNTNIQAIVQNYLESTPTISVPSKYQLVDSGTNEVKWVRYTATYTDPIEDTSTVTGYLGAGDGYSEFLDGVNYQLPTILTSSTRRKVSRSGIVIIPFINNDEYDTVAFVGDTTSLILTAGSEESTDFVRYAQVDISQMASSQESFRIVFRRPDLTEDDLTFNIVDDCRYTHRTVIFKNKFGFYDTLTMFSKSRESLNVMKDKFVNNYVSGGTYSTTKHQNQTINLTGTKSIECHSGFIKESENDIYEQMLLSEYVWFYEGGNLIPINPKTMDWQIKTRVNDSLIEYQVNFDYAYQLINNI